MNPNPMPEAAPSDAPVDSTNEAQVNEPVIVGSVNETVVVSVSDNAPEIVSETLEETPAETPAEEAPAEVPAQETSAEAPATDEAEVTPAVSFEEPAVEVAEEPAQEAAPAEEAPAETPVEETPAEEASAGASVETPAAPVEAPANNGVTIEMPTENVIEAPVSGMPGTIDPQVLAQAKSQNTPAKKNKTTLILSIILGIVVLVGIGIGVYMMLNNGNSNSGDKKTPATPTQTPISTGSVESVVNCKASGELWGIEETVTVDEDEKKVLSVSYKLTTNNTTITTQEVKQTENDVEIASRDSINQMIEVFKTQASVAGITISDKSDEEKSDFSYKAVRADIEDEDILETLFEGVDGLTADELKKQIESNVSNSSNIKLSCEVE